MTEAVQELLERFDALSEVDKRAAVVELLRRMPGSLPGDLADESLVDAAAELFAVLDSEESEHGED